MFPSSQQMTVTVTSSRCLLECGAGILKSLRSAISSPPPKAFLIRWALRLSSVNAQLPPFCRFSALFLPSIPCEPEKVGTREGSRDFGILPLIPAKWPPTRLTTSSLLYVMLGFQTGTYLKIIIPQFIPEAVCSENQESDGFLRWW